LSKLLGVLADVHGDLQALDAALTRLREMVAMRSYVPAT